MWLEVPGCSQRWSRGIGAERARDCRGGPTRLDRRIAEYLAGLDGNNAHEPDERQARQQRHCTLEAHGTPGLDRLAAKLDAEERNTLVEGELDARPMGIGKGPKPPSYNVLTAVDADTGLIVHHEVTANLMIPASYTRWRRQQRIFSAFQI